MSLQRLGIHILLGLYIIVGSLYSVVTPVMEASDELWHYPMVKYIADHWSLPVQDPENVGPWRQEGSQPPLYYIIAALLTGWIDSSDIGQVRWLNPHADSGIITQDGNTNLIIHDPNREHLPSWPPHRLYGGLPLARGWRGTVLAIHLIRLASVLMGAGTVYLTYLLAGEVWPQRKALALGAAAITAFNPMFGFVNAAVNNDDLAMLLGATGIWLLVRLVGRYAGQRTSGRRHWIGEIVVLGVILGLGALTKPSLMGLLPLTASAVGYVAWKKRSWWHFVSGGAITAGLVLLLSGWWFARNAALYDGDWLGIERFITILGYRVPEATLRQLWGERQSFTMAYWGLFGGVNVPMPGWTYAALNTIGVISVIGLVLGLVRYLVGLGWRGFLSHPTWSFQVLLTFLWPVAVFIPWALWATRTWSSQGRLVFSAISAWSLWHALGLVQVARTWRISSRWAWVPLGGLGVLLFALTAWVPWGVIAPSYRPPMLPAGWQPNPTRVLDAEIGEQVRLLGYDLKEAFAQPGGRFRFSLYWEALQPMDRNWSIFCHILDAVIESPVATRDRYPGQGLLATSLMRPGLRWVDEYVIELPQTAYAPSSAVLEVGLYDLETGERAPIRVVQGEGVQVVDNALRFQPLYIKPREGSVPNPVHINFGDRMALSGWDADPRVLAPAETLDLALYWEGMARMDQSYTVSAQVVGPGGGKIAQSDSSSPGDLDTATWRSGDQVVDRRGLRIDDNAPSGSYDLLVTIYWIDASQELKRLRIIDSEGRVLPQDSWILGQIRVAR